MKIELHQSEINDGIIYVEVSDGIRVEVVTNRRSAMVTITSKHQLFDVTDTFRTYSTRQKTVVRRQNISGNARVGTAIAGDVHGPIMSGSFDGPVNISNQMPNNGAQGVFREEINIGNVSNSSGLSFGRGSSSTVISHRNVNTGGGDYSEQNINKSGPPADVLIEVPIGIAVLITNY